MSTLRLGADELWYDDTGGDDVPLVLLHPGITDSRVWDPVLPYLAGRRVVRFDRRGFGRSPRATEPYSALGDLVGLLDQLGCETAHLVGNSMGGETSLALAVTSPERVGSLTLLCPGINGYPWPEDDPPELVAEWERCQAERDAPGLARLLSDLWFADGTDDYLDEQVRLTVDLDFSPAADLEQKNPEQWSTVGSLTVPTTVIAGERDPADSLQASIDLAAAIPDAVLVRLEADHVPQYREPEAVAQAVLATVERA